MQTLPRRLPKNVEQFRIAGYAVDGLDQEMLADLRRLADQTGETVEDHINRAVVEFVQRCQAEAELETKIIQFPKIKCKPTKSGRAKIAQPLFKFPGACHSGGLVWRTERDRKCNGCDQLQPLGRCHDSRLLMEMPWTIPDGRVM